jgi:hypothetical protein
MIRDFLDEIGLFWLILSLLFLAGLVVAAGGADLSAWLHPDALQRISLKFWTGLCRLLMKN